MPATECMGRPPLKNAGNILKVESAVNDDRRQTVHDLAEIAGCGKSTVYRILKSDLKMSKASARWVPRLLSEDEKLKRVSNSRTFFLTKLLQRTRLGFISMNLKTRGVPWFGSTVIASRLKKAKTVKSMGKVMCIMFIDRGGMILVHMVPEGKTVNANYYSKVIRRDLLNAIRKKRPELINEIENVVLHQDNAPPHTANTTQIEIDVLGFQRVDNPPYSPDLAPLDFKYFPELKNHLRGTRFHSRDEIMNAILSFNRTLPQKWFDEMFTTWLDRHRKCVAHGGEFFEKE